MASGMALVKLNAFKALNLKYICIIPFPVLGGCVRARRGTSWKEARTGNEMVKPFSFIGLLKAL